MKCVGIDLGFGNVKIRDTRGGTIFASHLHVPGVDYRLDDGGLGEGTSHIEFDNMAYVVGLRAPLSKNPNAGLDINRILGSSEIRATLYAAIGAHFASNPRWREGVTAYVGVPAALLVGEEKEANVAAIAAWMTGKHSWRQDGTKHNVTIDNVFVRSQATGAITDMAYNLDGTQSREALVMKGGFGIISVGYHTVELSGGMGGRPVPALIGSTPDGVSSMLAGYDRTGKTTVPMLDWKLRTGILNGHIEATIDQWADGVVSVVSSRWNSLAHQLDRVLLVGGGAKYAESALRQRFEDRLWIPSDPVIAIAQGLYKRAMADNK